MSWIVFKTLSTFFLPVTYKYIISKRYLKVFHFFNVLDVVEDVPSVYGGCDNEVLLKLQQNFRR